MLSYFSHKLDRQQETYLRNYRTETKKFAVAEKFYPQKWEVHVPNFILKFGIQVKFETPTHSTNTIPLHTNMVSTPLLPEPVTSKINAQLNIHYLKILDF